MSYSTDCDNDKNSKNNQIRFRLIFVPSCDVMLREYVVKINVHVYRDIQSRKRDRQS